MSSRLLKIRKHIQRTFAEILQREADLPPDVLVTVSDVEVSPNLHSAAIWLYISPLERASETLDLLKPQMYDLQGSFNRAVKMQPLPRLILKADRGALYAQQINEQLSALNDEKLPHSPDQPEGDGEGHQAGN